MLLIVCSTVLVIIIVVAQTLHFCCRTCVNMRRLSVRDTYGIQSTTSDSLTKVHGQIWGKVEILISQNRRYNRFKLSWVDSSLPISNHVEFSKNTLLKNSTCTRYIFKILSTIGFKDRRNGITSIL